MYNPDRGSDNLFTIDSGNTLITMITGTTNTQNIHCKILINGNMYQTSTLVINGKQMKLRGGVVLNHPLFSLSVLGGTSVTVIGLGYCKTLFGNDHPPSSNNSDPVLDTEGIGYMIIGSTLVIG